MRLYAGTVTQFVTDTNLNQIADKLRDSYFYYFRQNPSPSEMASWRNSLRSVAGLFDYCKLDDHGVILEYQLPMSSKRLDCIVTGKDAGRKGNAIIIELKQWECCKAAEGENEVLTYLGGSEREVLHPSVQVGRYKIYLEDYHAAFYEGPDPLGLAACSYLHNYSFNPDDVLLSDKFLGTLSVFPVFSANDVPALRDFIRPRVERGDGTDVLNRILSGKYRPSKKLMEHVIGIIEGNEEFVLLDEQLLIYDKVLSSVTCGFHDRKKQVVLVKGGPGTGKSVIAINLMADLMRKGYTAHYVTGSKAFTLTLRKVIGCRGAEQVRYFNSYMDAEKDEIDALICDEAHRLRESSNDRFTRKKSRSGGPQIQELLKAGKVCVFFIDEDQVVRPGEIGSQEYIRKAARENGSDISEYELEIQFRCGGSDGFVKWVENTLGIKRTSNVLWPPNENFDFRIMDFPQSLEEAIREKVRQGYKARMMAGFCWPWSKILGPDGRLVNDVVIGDYQRPWNAHPDIGKLPKGIPRAPLWANDPNGINQVGCVYTAQGFEFDYAGVVIGKDLRYSFENQGWEGHREESCDLPVKRSKDKFLELIKNTYRVLLSRAHKGCYVCFLDKETEKFFRSRMESERQVGKAAVNEAEAPSHTLFVDALPLYRYDLAEGPGKGLRIREEICPVPPGHYQSSHFLVTAEDERMQPTIPNGALCLFHKDWEEPYEGKIILCQLGGTNEPPFIAKTSIKRILEVREGVRNEKQTYFLEFDDRYQQPILFYDLKDVKILGVFEKVI